MALRGTTGIVEKLPAKVKPVSVAIADGHRFAMDT
jgi:hypothetical protein